MHAKTYFFQINNNHLIIILSSTTFTPPYQMCKVLFFLMGCQVKNYSSAADIHYQCSDSSGGASWEISCYPDELIRADRNEEEKKKEATKMVLSFHCC